MDVDAVHAVASELRGQLALAPLSLDLPGVDQARTIAADGVRQLDDYVLPRLANLDAPALAVVGGSTGAGKSTLVNSLLRSNVTRPGVLRPTTRAPVLVCRPEDIDWFDDDRVLPGLARVSGEAHGTAEISLATSPALPPRLALVDAPDIDSVVDSNRAMASQLLDAADLWVFVTTASRYADAVPWEFLQRAAQRGVVLGIVVNRLPPAAGEVVDHLREMLAEHGLDGTPVFAVDEQPLTDE
nr:dynamin family protein [Actinomycetota bacterium]